MCQSYLLGVLDETGPLRRRREALFRLSGLFLSGLFLDHWQRGGYSAAR
jgi:hypothetical protein